MHPANRDDDHPGVAARHLPPTEDHWPTLVSSRHPVGVEPAAGREVRQVDPRPRRARGRMSIAASICIALAGSAGAVSAVNATLFPSLGRPTNESVWQNPGKVPVSAAVPEPTTPRATRVVVVDPTSALVASVEVVVDLAAEAAEPTTSEAAPPSTLDEIVAARPAIRTPAAVSSGSGSGSGGSVPGVTSTQPPTTNSSDHATTSTTDRGGVQGPDTTADTTPHATDGSVPSNTAGSIPDDDGSSGNGSGKGGSGGKGGG